MDREQPIPDPATQHSGANDTSIIPDPAEIAGNETDSATEDSEDSEDAD